MNCLECGKAEERPTWEMRGYCDECDVKKRTCDVCGKLVELEGIWQRGTKKGHISCLGNDCKGGCET